MIEFFNGLKNIFQRRDTYIRPSDAVIRSSLAAMRDLIDGSSSDTSEKVEMKIHKWYEMLARGNAEDRIAEAKYLYALASGRQAADLEKEVPDIVEAIRNEYRPPEDYETEIRITRAPLDLLLETINDAMASLD